MGRMAKPVSPRDAAPDAISPRPLTRNQRLLHALYFVVMPWIAARGDRVMAALQWGARGAGDWRRFSWLAVQRMQAGLKVLTALNFLVFLRRGRSLLSSHPPLPVARS